MPVKSLNILKSIIWDLFFDDFSKDYLSNFETDLVYAMLEIKIRS